MTDGRSRMSWKRDKCKEKRKGWRGNEDVTMEDDHTTFLMFGELHQLKYERETRRDDRIIERELSCWYIEKIAL
jgi:hypothetical protein